MGYGWLNIGSILLGIIALAVLFRGVAADKKWKPRLAVSAAACAAAIGLQALYRFRWRLGRPCRYGGPGGDGKRFPFGADRPDQFHYDPRTLFRQAMNRFFALCW